MGNTIPLTCAEPSTLSPCPGVCQRKTCDPSRLPVFDDSLELLPGLPCSRLGGNFGKSDPIEYCRTVLEDPEYIESSPKRACAANCCNSAKPEEVTNGTGIKSEVPDEHMSLSEGIGIAVGGASKSEDLKLQPWTGKMVISGKAPAEFKANVAVGSSLNKDLFQAIVSAGDKVVKKLGNLPSFVVATMMVPPQKDAKLDQVDLSRAADCLRQRFPDVPFVGALSMGGLQTHQVDAKRKSAHHPVVALWGIHDPGGIYMVFHSRHGEKNTRSSVLDGLSQVPEEAGSPQLVFAFAASGCERAITNDIASVVPPNTAVVGGTPWACSITGRSESWQISNATTTTGAVCAAFCWPSVRYDPLPLFPWFSLDPKPAQAQMHGL